MIRRFSFIVFFTILFAYFFSGAAANLSGEFIESFVSDVVVEQDASLLVTEKIRVHATGNEIKHGIVRRFPTTYKDAMGQKKRVGFDVLFVLKDGKSSPYHVQKISNGLAVYVGEKNVILKPGTYTYTLRYRTDRQLGYFKEYDELYWNVTGNEWSFPIEYASVKIQLPGDVKIIKYAGFTGRMGERGQEYLSSETSNSEISFTTKKTLYPGEGFTVAVAWPSGFVYEPTSVDNVVFFAKENMGTAISFFVLILLTAYYYYAWYAVGRDPREGTIIPLFEPPAGFSPAALRFIRRMGFDDKTFAAAIVNMAVKHFIRIREYDGEYTLERLTKDQTHLSLGEKKVADALFQGVDAVTMKNTNHEIISGAIKNLKQSLRSEFEKIYFIRNSIYLVPGVLLTMIAVAAIVINSDQPDDGIFFAMWLSIWTFACYSLFMAVLNRWTSGVHRLNRLGSAIGVTLTSLPFFAGEIFGIVMFAHIIGMMNVLMVIALILINALFYELLKAPTLKGRQLMDQIEGFKLYLSTTEKNRLNQFTPPEKTPTLFETYLPFALALNVENEWAQQFTDVLNAATVGGEHAYSPSWYSGDSWQTVGTPSYFTSALGAGLAGAVASAATAPGSTSGTGGGGFSGGGGGGGGGGGW